MRRFQLWTIVAAVMGMANALVACPMCKDSLVTTKADAVSSSLFAGGGAGVSGGFNYSIYCMILGFFLALGVVIVNVGRGLRK
jgi:hypothetical protein